VLSFLHGGDMNSGTELEAVCAKLRLSVKDMAFLLGVSRTTMYSWFSGIEPKGDHLRKVRTILELATRALSHNRG
jgi:predicted transcriptional regulator